MDSRALVTAVLVVAAGVGVSMLLFLAVSSLGGPPDVTTVDEPGLDPAVPNPYSERTTDPVVILEVGEAGDGIPIRVWNDGPAARDVSMKLIHNDSRAVLVDRTESVPSNATIRMEIRRPAGYLLEVTDEATGTTGTYAVSTDQFDCNERFATVKIAANGHVDSRSIATTMGCA